jgi:hypothetical protein
MALSKEIVSQFAKLANDKKEPNEATVTGVYNHLVEKTMFN